MSYDGRRETVYSETVQNAHDRFYSSKRDASYARLLKADYVWLPRELPVVAPLERDGWIAIFRGPRSVVLARRGGAVHTTGAVDRAEVLSRALTAPARSRRFDRYLSLLHQHRDLREDAEILSTRDPRRLVRRAIWEEVHGLVLIEGRRFRSVRLEVEVVHKESQHRWPVSVQKPFVIPSGVSLDDPARLRANHPFS